MSLSGKKIAIFLENFFEDTEFWYPYYRMKEEDAEVTVVAPKKELYKGKHGLLPRLINLSMMLPQTVLMRLSYPVDILPTGCGVLKKWLNLLSQWIKKINW